MAAWMGDVALQYDNLLRKLRFIWCGFRVEVVDSSCEDMLGSTGADHYVDAETDLRAS